MVFGVLEGCVVGNVKDEFVKVRVLEIRGIRRVANASENSPTFIEKEL